MRPGAVISVQLASVTLLTQSIEWTLVEATTKAKAKRTSKKKKQNLSRLKKRKRVLLKRKRSYQNEEGQWEKLDPSNYSLHEFLSDRLSPIEKDFLKQNVLYFLQKNR